MLILLRFFLLTLFPISDRIVSLLNVHRTPWFDVNQYEFQRLLAIVFSIQFIYFSIRNNNEPRSQVKRIDEDHCSWRDAMIEK